MSNIAEMAEQVYATLHDSEKEKKAAMEVLEKYVQERMNRWAKVHLLDIKDGYVVFVPQDLGDNEIEAFMAAIRHANPFISRVGFVKMPAEVIPQIRMMKV